MTTFLHSLGSSARTGLQARSFLRRLVSPTPVHEKGLFCVECAREQLAGERGWRAYLTVDDEVAIFCPSCAAREFGDPGND